MRYIVSGEFTEIAETSGTIQNTSKINVVEVSDTNEKGSGIMLYPLDRFTFSKSIYARCVDGGGAEVRVVPFEVGTQRGGEQGTTPSGGGSGIAFAGMILGTESSTVDGGLWFEVVDGLPVVKMNHGGDEFLIDTKPAEDTLIGNKLFLAGHEFNLTGFADGLTFSDNNFYSGGDSTPIGSVSNYQFVFTDAAALSAADGDTISIAQLDTDAVNLSLDLDNLNTIPTPWNFAKSTSKISTYTAGTSNYIRKNDAEYSFVASPTQHTLAFEFAVSLYPDKTLAQDYVTEKGYGVTGSSWRRALTNLQFPAEYVTGVTIVEKYDNNNITGFDVTINDAELIQYSSGDWSYFDASAESSLKVNINFADDLGVDIATIKDGHLDELMDEDGNFTGYTFTAPKYISGFECTQTTETDSESNPVTKYSFLYFENTHFSWRYAGCSCTIEGLAQGLTIVPFVDSTYRCKFYKDRTVDDNGNVTAEGTQVGGTIYDPERIIITDIAALKDFDENTTEFTVTVAETQSDPNRIAFFAPFMNNAMLFPNEEDTAEGFTLSSTTEGDTTINTYTYHTGKIAKHFAATVTEATTNGQISSSTYVPETTVGYAAADGKLILSGDGLRNCGELLLDDNDYIYYMDDEDKIVVGEFDGEHVTLNHRAFDNTLSTATINIITTVSTTPIDFTFALATDADTAAISRTFANETFTTGSTAGTYIYTATGSTAGWNVSADGSQIASWELNGKTFTIENLRTDLGDLGFDSQGYIHATNGSTIGRMGGNVIKLYDTAVHKLATPILTGADAADFTLILPN